MIFLKFMQLPLLQTNTSLQQTELLYIMHKEGLFLTCCQESLRTQVALYHFDHERQVAPVIWNSIWQDGSKIGSEMLNTTVKINARETYKQNRTEAVDFQKAAQMEGMTLAYILPNTPLKALASCKWTPDCCCAQGTLTNSGKRLAGSSGLLVLNRANRHQNAAAALWAPFHPHSSLTATKSLKSTELALIQAGGNESRISTLSLRLIILVIVFLQRKAKDAAWRSYHSFQLDWIFYTQMKALEKLHQKWMFILVWFFWHYWAALVLPQAKSILYRWKTNSLSRQPDHNSGRTEQEQIFKMEIVAVFKIKNQRAEGFFVLSFVWSICLKTNILN